MTVNKFNLPDVGEGLTEAVTVSKSIGEMERRSITSTLWPSSAAAAAAARATGTSGP